MILQPKERPQLEILNVSIGQCRDFIKYINTDYDSKIDQLIDELNTGVIDAETLRRNILISKTTGTSVGAVGGVLVVTGFVLAPFTAGISAIVMSSIGGALSIGGAATNITASIVEPCLEKTQGKKICKLLDDLKKLQDCFKQKYQELQVNLKDLNLKECDLSEYVTRIFDPLCDEKERQIEIKKWLESGYLHQDEVVNPKDLRMGDHIFRKIRSSPLHYHHAIYMNEDEVVELVAKEGIISRSLSEYRENQILHRRQYRGYDLTKKKTEKLIRQAMKYSKYSYQYNLVTSNCEHFATCMKLKVSWSGQVHSATKITAGIAKNLPRPISLTLEGVEVGTQLSLAIAPKVSGIFSFFKSVPVSSLSSLSKVAIVLTPISVALDITSLVYAYKDKNASVEFCKETIAKLEETKSFLQSKKRYFQDLLQFLIERGQNLIEEDERRKLRELDEMERQRSELEEIEQRRWNWFAPHWIILLLFCLLNLYKKIFHVEEISG